MPAAGVDSSIPLQAQAPQFDLASIYSAAMQLRQQRDDMQFNNSLKQILATTPVVKPDGSTDANALAQIARLGPKGLEFASKISAQQGEAQERQAHTKHEQAETTVADLKSAHETLRSGLDAYDAEVSGGNTAPDIAERDLKTTMKSYIDSLPISQERRDQQWQAMSRMTPAQLRAGADKMAMTIEERERQAAEQDRQRAETERERHDTVEERLGGERVDLSKRGEALREKVATGGAGALSDDDLSFAAEMVLNGQPMPNMGYGAKGAAARAAILHKAAEMAKGQSGSSAAGADETVVRRDSLRADQASLTGIRKQQASVSQFAETALGLTDKIEGMMSKGTTKAGPEWLAGIVQKVRTGQLGDPDTREFLGYITDLESENAKIMAGATGSVAQVSAHNQALMNQIIKGDMPASEMAGALKTIRAGIQLRQQSLADEIARQKGQLRADTAGGGQAAGGISHPTNKADFDALPKGAHYSKPGDAPGTYRIKS